MKQSTILLLIPAWLVPEISSRVSTNRFNFIPSYLVCLKVWKYTQKYLSTLEVSMSTPWSFWVHLKYPWVHLEVPEYILKFLSPHWSIWVHLVVSEYNMKYLSKPWSTWVHLVVPEYTFKYLRKPWSIRVHLELYE